MSKRLAGLILFGLEVLTYYYILTLLPFGHYKRIGVLWFLLMYISGHFALKQVVVWDDIRSTFKTTIIFVISATALIYPYEHFVLNMSILSISMMFISLFYSRLIRIILRNYISSKTLIIGTNSTAARLGQILKRNRYALMDLKGYVRYGRKHISEYMDENDTIFPYKDIHTLIKDKHIDKVFICIFETDIAEEIVNEIKDEVDAIDIVPQIDNLVTFATTVEDYDGIITLSSSKGIISIVDLLIKRLIDICAGVAGCIILLPLYFVVRHMNHKQGDYDDIFFVQDRIGKGGKAVKIYKFRTMVPNAEQVLEELMASNPAIKEEYLTNKKLKDDPRITKAGEFLRKTSLDEFPQFINVLKGEMSLIGPRPYLFREIEDMGDYYKTIIKVKPGITGMWQANGRSDVRFKDRLIMDDYYYRNWKISLDLNIFYKTVKSVIYGKGAI